MTVDRFLKLLFNISLLFTLLASSLFSSDDLLSYNTVQIRTTSGSGTGFFLNLNICDHKISCLVTNKHVTRNSTSGDITFHLKDEEGRLREEQRVFNIEEQHWRWIDHPGEVDLCVMLLGPIIGHKADICCHFLEEERLITDEELAQLTPVSTVMMIGYPIGLFDPTQNFPIFRQGITATHPGKSYNPYTPHDYKPQFLIDAACWPGSSGSPVFLRTPITTRDGTIYHAGTTPMDRKLLGILWGGPMHNANGTIIVQEIPMALTPISQTSIPTNLGFVIHARELLRMKDAIIQTLNNTTELNPNL